MVALLTINPQLCWVFGDEGARRGGKRGKRGGMRNTHKWQRSWRDLSVSSSNSKGSRLCPLSPKCSSESESESDCVSSSEELSSSESSIPWSFTCSRAVPLRFERQLTVSEDHMGTQQADICPPDTGSKLALFDHLACL